MKLTVFFNTHIIALGAMDFYGLIDTQISDLVLGEMHHTYAQLLVIGKKLDITRTAKLYIATFFPFFSLFIYPPIQDPVSRQS